MFYRNQGGSRVRNTQVVYITQRAAGKKGEKMRDQLTQSDIDKMQEEIDYRKLVKRPELIEHVKAI